MTGDEALAFFAGGLFTLTMTIIVGLYVLERNTQKRF